MLNVLRNRFDPQYLKSGGSVTLRVVFGFRFVFFSSLYMLVYGIAVICSLAGWAHINSTKKGSKKMSSSVRGRGKGGGHNKIVFHISPKVEIEVRHDCAILGREATATCRTACRGRRLKRRK